MFIKNLSKRERNIAATTVLLIGAAFVYNFIIEPVAGQWASLNSQIESKADALKRDIRMLSNRKAIEEEYAKFSKYVKPGKSEEEATAETLSYLENLSRSDSCLIVNMKPISTKDFGAYKELLIDMSSEGAVNQFTKFLYDVENSKNMILKVRQFVLTPKAGQEGTLKGSFLISKIIIE